MNIEYEQEIMESFPNLQYKQFILLDNKQERLAIDDLSYKYPARQQELSELAELFILSCWGFINFYDASSLSRTLNNQLDDILERLNPERSLLIFPGNGAKIVKDLLRPEVFRYFPTLNLTCNRILTDNMSVSRVDVTTGRQVIKAGLPSKLISCVLIDDVLLSGTTAQSVRSSIDTRNGFEWSAAMWMSLSPLQARIRRQNDEYRSGLPGFRRVATSVIYQGTSGTPANNSLSSFSESDEKANMVIESYKRKYVEDYDTFDQVIEKLRRLKSE